MGSFNQRVSAKTRALIAHWHDPPIKLARWFGHTDLVGFFHVRKFRKIAPARPPLGRYAVKRPVARVDQGIGKHRRLFSFLPLSNRTNSARSHFIATGFVSLFS